MLSLQVRVDLGAIAMKRVLHITQISKVGASPSDGLMSYPGHSLRESYLSVEMQSVYSSSPADWAILVDNNSICFLDKWDPNNFKLKSFQIIKTNGVVWRHLYNVTWFLDRLELPDKFKPKYLRLSISDTMFDED